MTDVVITHALRTPVGTFNGQLSSLPAHALGTTVIQNLLKQSQINPNHINEVILGQILTAATGQNPARQAALNAGLPESVTALGVNQLCGSGVRSVAMAYQSIRLGDSKVVIAGGQESMSQAPHTLHLRQPHKMGDTQMVDTMLKDGLLDAFHGYHMGQTAENIATQWQITRQEQDTFSLASQTKAANAIQNGKFKDEIVPVTVKSRKENIIIDTDEHPKPQTTLETLAKLKPAFSSEGTVTAGNASGINDGAACLMVMGEKTATEYGFKPLARIASWATAGVDPAVMGTGPIPASRKALQKAGWTVHDLDIIEANEAFAAQAISVNRDLGWDESKVNPNGGAIALGHPIGASGARILCTLIYEMQKRDARKGLATLCIGGGMGIALCLERE